LTTKVRAAVVDTAGESPTVQEVEILDPAFDEVLVRVAATGICHTDLARASGSLESPYPVVLGHETSGVVEAVGRDVTRVSPGDKVVIALTHHCGHCSYCEAGHPMLCARRTESPTRIVRNGEPVHQGFGVGGFAEALVVREVSCVKVPDGVPLEVAALIGCAVATGMGAVMNIARVDVGSTVLVLGAGGIGVSVIMGALLAGAEQITVIEPDPDRRRRALAAGATNAVEPGSSNLDSMTKDGFDFVFESAGSIATMQEAVSRARRGGTVTLIGAPATTALLTIPALDFVADQKKLLGCITGDLRPDTDFDKYFRLYLRGKLDLDSLVTATLPLDRINEGFESAASSNGIRTLITQSITGRER
jgi:Zn-dependent alcohol dehydrogenase